MSSYSFSIEIVDEDDNEERSKNRESNIYLAIEEENDQHFKKVIELQELLKSQALLLEYEQKRKNERIKQIQYNYMNSFTNFLWAYHGQDKKDPFILLNNKDIISLNEDLPEEVQILFKRILDEKPLAFRNEQKPTVPFLCDFMNFWPHWHTRIRQIIRLELESAEKIEACFQSQYTFASKVLANLRLNYKIQRFCAEIFEDILNELDSINEELNVDFSGLYERWTQLLPSFPNLKRFLEGGQDDFKGLKGQLQKIFGRFKNDQQIQLLLQEIVHFQRSTHIVNIEQSAIAILLTEVGQDEIPEGLNLRLAWLVWKKILQNRKKLQNLATSLLASIIYSYQRIPHEIKYVVRCFKEEAEKRFGPLRFQDLKSFFNKVIFSQLFFSQFMILYENKTVISPNANLTLLALLSQKIMFGQQFYEKFKFGFLNPIILHYLPTVKQFIMGFASESIKALPTRFINILLISFETLQFVFEVVRHEVRPLPALEVTICNLSCHTIAGKTYPHKNIYLSLIQRISMNYTLLLRPGNKVKRTLIDFLIIIDKISQKKSLKTLIQQYKSLEQQNSGSQPSVQLYAIYLQEVISPVILPIYIQEIISTMEEGKKQIESNKIGLQKQQNYSTNLEKMYMHLLNKRRTQTSKEKLKIQINALLNAQLGFNYDIEDEKIIEGGEGKSNKTFKKCLSDIAESFLLKREGVDGLYHLFWQRIAEQLQKGVNPDNMLQNTKKILGEKLYSMLKLNSYMSEKDYKLLTQMQKHEFVTLKMLDLPKYEEEEELILRESQKLINELSRPCCPDRILKIFYEITLIFQNVILITGSATDITADVQIPMMLVVIIHSKVKNLVTLLDFVEKFCAQDIYSSVLGQTLTLLKSVVYLIDELDHKKLGMDQQEYQKSMINNSYVIVQ